MLSNVENTVLLAEKLNSVGFRVPEYDTLLEKMQLQHESVAVRVNGGEPWGAGNRRPVRGIIVTGHHYCGKSDLVAQCLEAIEPITAGDGQTIEPNTRHIDAPHIFTQASQARAIMAVMGYPLTRKMTPDVAWSRLSDRLPLAAITQLAVDNWQWSFVPSQVGQASKEAEKRKIQAAYCNLLDHPVWPLPLILIGLPEVETELAAVGMEHIKDRCDVVRIGRLGDAATEHNHLLIGIKALCEEARLELNFVESDHVIGRLIHASDEARGVAITLAKLAVLYAVRSASNRLEIQHFRDVYASTAGCRPPELNPFIAENWRDIDTSGAGTKVDLMSDLMAMNSSKKAVTDAQ